MVFLILKCIFKCLSIWVHMIRRNCIYEKYEHKNGEGDSYIPPPNKKLFAGIEKHLNYKTNL